MSTWTERVEIFFSLLYKVKEEKKQKPNIFVRFFQRLQAQRLAEAERIVNDRMKYWHKM
jgi:hypothetical protein